VVHAARARARRALIASGAVALAEPELDRTFAALADPTRRAVIALLRSKPLRSSEMADALSTSRPAMSRHLRVLREAGLVEEESPNDDARVRMYQLRREPFSDLRSWLDEVEAFWAGQLAAFKAHAERRAGARPRQRR
jgi:DNA-binding transcriptional ArsR family regulator